MSKDLYGKQTDYPAVSESFLGNEKYEMTQDTQNKLDVNLQHQGMETFGEWFNISCTQTGRDASSSNETPKNYPQFRSKCGRCFFETQEKHAMRVSTAT